MGAQTIALIGAGTMGRGIARVALRRGFNVALFDTNSEVLRRVAVDPDMPSASTAEGGNLAVVDSIASAVDGAVAVIESVVESELVKAAVLKEVALATHPDVLLATNTSTFSIAKLAAAAGCSGRLVGMHFFNPAEKMRLVEVAVADGVPDRYIRRCTDLCEALGKTPVVVKDSPGFVTSRLGLLLGNEAMYLVASGVASAGVIDLAMRLGYNHPMGPLELADLVGLDARLNNLNALSTALGDERYRPPQILIDLVDEGYLGRKSGRGFYLYDDTGSKLDADPPVLTISGGSQ